MKNDFEDRPVNNDLYRILYVEDEHELAESVISVMKAHGFSVAHADNEKLAIQKTQNEKFDMLIFDIHLTTGTGDNAIVSIQKSMINPNNKTPIIVVSSHIDHPLIMKLKGRIEGAIVKPFEVLAFVKKLEEIIQNKS